MGLTIHSSRTRFAGRLNSGVRRLMRAHRMRSFYKTCAACITAILICACAPRQRPFLQVQLCVANSEGADLFKRTLQSIAREEHMRYVDGSEATTRDLKSIA